MNKKLQIGWFSFSCCEDSTIMFTELLNDHFQEWKKYIDFKSILVLQRREDLSDLDVAFVEGAITHAEQEQKLQHIRSIAKKVVAIGSCACTGMPSGQRNLFSPEKKAEIEALLARFQYSPQVHKIADLITVDHQVMGCPMDETAFLKVLNDLLVEFGIVAFSSAPSQK